MGSERTLGEKVERRAELAVTGFQDRELRYRADIVAAQDVLLQYSKEAKGIRAISSRQTEEVKLLREALQEAMRSREANIRFEELELARAKTDLAEVTADREQLDERLADLKEQSARQEKVNHELRKRVEQLRSGVTVLDS